MKKISLLFLALLFLSTSFAQEMQVVKWLHERPQGNNLRAVKMWDVNNIYALGGYGTFMKSSDGGNTWWFHHQASKKSTTGYYFTLYDAHFFNMSTIVAVGDGGIYRTTDAGLTWDSVYNTSSAGAAIYQVYFVDNNVGFAGGVSSVKMLKTTDGGLTWNLTGYPAVTCYDVYSPDGNIVLGTSSSGNVYRSTDGGATFGSAISTGTSVSLYKMTFKDSLFGVVAGTGGSARLTTDGGLTWSSISLGLPSTDSFYDIDIINDNIYLTGDSYALFRSVNNGTSWDTVRVLDPVMPWTSTYYATDFLDANTFTIVGAFGLINKRVGDVIKTYSQFIKPGQLNDIWRDPNSQKIIAVGGPAVTGGSFDQIIMTTNMGVNWSVVHTSKSLSNKVENIEPVEDIEKTDSKDVEEKTPNSYSTLRSISMPSSNIGYVAGSLGAIYKTTNGGLTWDSLITTIPNTADLYKIDFINETNGMVFSNFADTAGTIWKTVDGGATWTRLKIGPVTGSTHKIYGGDVVNENYAWLINWTPKPYKTTDGGLTWTAQTLSDGYAGYLYDIQMLDTLNGVCIGGSGHFYRTSDGGNVWQAYPTPTTSTLNSVSFVNAMNGLISGPSGMIYLTLDGGATWTSIHTGGGTIYGTYINVPTAGDSISAYFCGINGYVLYMPTGLVPVELASFTSSVTGNSVTLNWSTATETNNFGFNVERKVNGTWNKVGFVNGSGTTSERRSYSFTETLNSGKYNYRLKQIDHDGSFKYYNLPEVIEIGLPVEYKLTQNYPNPFNPSTIINYSIPNAGNVSIKVYNIIGKEVAIIVNGYQEAGNYTRQFNASENGLSSGVYFYTIKSGSFTDTKKMVILK